MTLPTELPEDLALKPVPVNFHPGPEYGHLARNWQGIPGIERAPNGRLWATWYSGGRTEDQYNHVVLVTSNDNGHTWSEPVLVVDPPADIRASDSTLWHDPHGRLWLFWMQNKAYSSGGTPYDGRGGVWCIHCTDSRVAAPTWSAPRRIANGTMLNKPTVLSTGEWLMPCNVYSLGRTYPHSVPEEQFSNVFVSRDNGETFSLLGSADVPNRQWDEHMIIERRDGSLWMLVRRFDGIGEAISTDRGKTWAASSDAILPGPCSRFHIRRLRSGRLLLINHDQFTNRSHLTALLSDDEGVTWPNHLLLDERSNISYPDAVETPEGRILVIYDRERTGDGEILMQEFTEEDILHKRLPGHESGRIRVVSRLARPNIGSRRELFVDRALIDQMNNVTCQLHHPVRKEAAFVADYPWEGSGSGFITVFRDENKFRMYYKGFPMLTTLQELPAHPLFVCYAESVDGLHWERPELGLFEFQGSKKNNIVFAGAGQDAKGVHGFAPFLDTNPACKPEHRYKAVGGLGPDNKITKGDLYAVASPDGIHWSLLQEAPILKNRLHGYFDSQNLAFWDTERGEYRIYFRDYIDRGMPTSTRAIKTARSNNFVNWTDFALLEYPDAPREQLYTSQVQPYYRAPHLFVGFPTRYVQRPWSPAIEALPEVEQRRWRAEMNERFGTSLTDGLFMSSRDGQTFHRWEEAFIRPGPQRKGNWVYGDNFQALGMFETPSDLPGAPNELSFLVTENYWRQPGAIFRRHTIRIDGFVSVNAPRGGGQLSLKPFRFQGSTLRLNFATSAAGSIRVQLEDFGGAPLQGYTLEDCYEIIGDELDRPVQWKHGSDTSPLAGKLVRVRFALSDADLYSFRFVTDHNVHLCT